MGSKMKKSYFGKKSIIKKFSLVLAMIIVVPAVFIGCDSTGGEWSDVGNINVGYSSPRVETYGSNNGDGYCDAVYIDISGRGVDTGDVENGHCVYKNTKVILNITIDGEEFNVVQDARELTAGQYIDYQHYLGVDDFDGQLPNILTVFVIPKGKKYGEGYNMAELAKLFKDKMPIITALEISSFFLRQSLTSIKASLTSLRIKMRMTKMTTRDKEMRKMIQEGIDRLGLLKDSISSLVGLTQL